MRLNFKVIVLGGLAFFITQFILSFATGPVIHNGMLLEAYQANSAFWRPELNQDPPDMAALMPRWITIGVIAALILAAVYDNIRSAFDGSAVLQGVKYGLVLFLFSACITAGWSGVFNLPNEIWLWWGVEGLIYYVVGGAVLGWTVAKLSPA